MEKAKNLGEVLRNSMLTTGKVDLSEIKRKSIER